MMSARLVFDRDLRTLYGPWHEYLFDVEGSSVLVMAFGRWREEAAPLLRVHSSCIAADWLASVECDCRDQLHLAYRRIAAAGAGLLIPLEQDGRGNGHLALMKAAVFAKEHGCTVGDAYEAVGFPADARSYRSAAAAVRALGLTAVTLLTDNPRKISAFVEEGIHTRSDHLVIDDRAFDRYYELKAREGYTIV